MMSKPRRLSLRGVLATMTSIVVSVALLVTAALVVLTTVLQETTSSAAGSVESVRLAQEAEIDLLLHSRAWDALVKRDIEERLFHHLSEAHHFVSSNEEMGIVKDAEARLAAYIAAARSGTKRDLSAHQEAAYGTLEALVSINLAQARDADARAARWNELANQMGLVVGILLLVAAVSVLLWLKRRAFEPIFSLSDAMERFARGDHESRAPEIGPTELQDMSRQFNEMAGALATQRQARIAFLGGVAHDLRNPLSALEMSVALISPDKPLPSEPRLRHLIKTIDRQISQLARMSGDFLDMARIDAGELELRLDLHDAREMVRHVVELFEGTAPKPQLLVSLPERPVILLCDHLRMEQVMTNLISNAIKYSPAGSSIEVAVEVEDHEVILSVADHGVGIPEPDHQRIFEPFRRVGLSKEGVPGVGLGLFVVRRIVETHGGHIDVESTPGLGSTFRVRMPQRDSGSLPGLASDATRELVH